MFICNFKINSNFILKLFLSILFILVFLIIAISVFKFFNTSSLVVDDTVNKPEIYNLTANNYTSVLKTVHSNIDKYIGQQINFSGYVYRVYDFDETQFVLARDMIISSDFQTLVVGFLCHCDTASLYETGSWVNITGTITKGNYHGEIPVIEIKNIKAIEKPEDEYVYPPDETYVTTSTVL